MAVQFPAELQSVRFRQSLSLWERWHGASRDGEGEVAPRSAALPQEAGAANAVRLYDPTREKANRENPQIFPIGKFKIILPLKMARAQAEAISNHFFSCSSSPSRGVM